MKLSTSKAVENTLDTISTPAGAPPLFFFAIIAGAKPSAAIAMGICPITKILPFKAPAVEIKAPTPINSAPPLPMCAAASTKGDSDTANMSEGTKNIIAIDAPT